MKRMVFVCLVAFSACVTPGPFLRVATASSADFKDAENKDVVWYEFQPGDEVPFQLVFFGAMEGGAQPAKFRAKRKFFLVARKNQPMALSFDGENAAGSFALRSIVVVLPNDGGPGGRVGWMTYIGDAQDPDAELKEFLERDGDSPAQATR